MPTRTQSPRTTRPDYSLGIYRGAGLQIIPRRGWDADSARYLDAAEQQGVPALREFYRRAPLYLLRIFVTIHPLAKTAHSNNSALSFSPGDTVVEAIETTRQENGESAELVDSEATAELKAFWGRYRGGLMGFQRALGAQLEWGGMCCAEAVPAPRGQGLARVVTFDPLTVFFRDSGTGEQSPYQSLLRPPDSSAGGAQAGTPLPDQEIALDPQTTFLVPLDGDDDNPYGVPLFSGALAEMVKDLGQEANLSDLLRGWANPHTLFGFPVEELHQHISEHPEVLVGAGESGEDLSVHEYITREFEAFCDFLRGINPDDPIVGPKGIEGKVLEAGTGLAALDPLLKMRRHRLVIGLDQLPNMLGITEGGTQAYAKEQTRLVAKKLEAFRYLVNEIVRLVSDLYLRLRGLNRTARISAQPVLPADRLAEAQARQIEAQTDHDLVAWGWMDAEEAAVRNTGSAPVGEDSTEDDDPQDPAEDDAAAEEA